MQIAGIGISVNDVVMIVAVAVLITGISMTAIDSIGKANYNWLNFFSITTELYNNAFFNGADVTKCGNIIDGIFNQGDMFQQNEGALGSIINVFVGFANVLVKIGNLIGSILILIYRILTDCGLSVLRLIIGFGVFAFIIYHVIVISGQLRESVSK